MQSPDGGRRFPEILETLPGGQGQTLVELSVINAFPEPRAELEILSASPKQSQRPSYSRSMSPSSLAFLTAKSR